MVKKLGFLKSIPGLPLLFDSLLKLWMLITRPYLLEYLDEIETEVLKWQGTTLCLHRYGGIQFNCRGTEIGHIHSNGILDILFDKSLKSSLLKEGKISHHHVFKNSGWISFYIRRNTDMEYAKKLLGIAYSRTIKRKQEHPTDCLPA